MPGRLKVLCSRRAATILICGRTGMFANGGKLLRCPRNLATNFALRAMSLIPTSAPDRSTLNSSVVRRSLGQTSRRDVWWVWPVLVVLGLSTFIVYSTLAAFHVRDY